MIAALVFALTIVSSCTGNQTPTPLRSGDSEKTAVAGIKTVRVSFSGLMVLHREEKGPGYELGILVPSAAQGHVFSVTQDGVPITLSNGGRWTLSIVNAPPMNTHIGPVEVGHPNSAQPVRKPDHAKGLYDFSWIIDFESAEFHGKELDLQAGLMKPIMHLPNVALYSLNKSIDLKRGQGTGAMNPFGFVTETMAMNIELHQGEELVLKDEDTSTKLLGIPFASGQAPSDVKIKNVRPVPSMASDFKMYYKLFPKVDTKDQFDFDENSKDLPYNPTEIRAFAERDQHLKVSCCGMDCSLILLGKRTAALK